MKDPANRGEPGAVPQTVSDAQWTRICDGAVAAFADQAGSDAWQATATAIAAKARWN